MAREAASGSDIPQRIMSGIQVEYIASHAGRSQYSRVGGGVSACGLAALNCARLVLGMESAGLSNEKVLREMMKRETLEEVLKPCLSWSSPAHLDVDQIYETPIFSKSLKLIGFDYGRPGSETFKALLLRLSQSTRSTRSSACAIITRPPEILTCIKLATSHSDVFVIFDSHPRPNKHPHGAAFIFLSSMDSAANYLTELLRFDERLLMDSTVQWQAQLLAHFSAHIFTAQNSVDSVAELTLQASLEVLKLKANVLELQGRITTLSSENGRLVQDVARLEDEIDDFKAKDRRHRLAEGPPSSENESRHPNAASYTQSGMGEMKSEKSRGKESCRSPNTTTPTVSHTQRVSERSAGKATYSQVASSSTHHSNRVHRPAHEDDLTVATVLQMQADEANDDLIYAVSMQREFDKESVRLQREFHHLKSTVQDTFHCGICFEEYSLDIIAVVELCGHKFCRGCIHGYTVAKVEEHRYPIQCPICMVEKGHQVSGIIDNRFVQQIGLSEKQYEIFLEMQMAAFSVIIHCRQCQSSVFVDKKEYDAAELIVCPIRGCNYAWCKACTQKIKIGGPRHSCDGSSELKDLMDQKAWRYCPGCQTPAEKIDGCNHMTCITPGCNTHFCYLCGNSITQSVRRQAICSAVSAHYRQCQLFEDIV